MDSLASLRASLVIALILLGSGKSAQTAASEHTNIPVSNADDKESDFPGYLGNVLGPKKAPCEAGAACGRDQCCSPSRHVCRPCGDIALWCNHTDLVLTRFPDCQSFCYQTLLGQAEKCTVQNQILQNRLHETELALSTVQEEADSQRAELETVTQDLRQQEKRGEDKQNIILALAIVSSLSLLWALATSFHLWRHFLRYPSPQGISFRDSALAQDSLLLVGDFKCPSEVNTIDSGEFCGNC